MSSKEGTLSFQMRPADGRAAMSERNDHIAAPPRLEAPQEAAPRVDIPDPKILIRDLNFYYGKFHALQSINMQIAERQVTAFIGPSGCGKSTLLRSFNRIYELYPDQRATGQIMLDGANVLEKRQDLNLLRAKVGMVFQKPTPFPMSIYDNVAFGIRLYERLSRAEMADRVEWALTKAALWNEVKDKLKQGGGSPAASSSACVSPALSPSSRRCCCSTSPPRPSIPSPPPISRN